MISKQRILEISNLIKGRIQSALESLSATAASIRASWMEETNQVVAMTNVVNAIESETALSSEEDAYFMDLVTNRGEIAFNIDQEVHTFHLGSFPLTDSYLFAIDNVICGQYNFVNHTLAFFETIPEQIAGVVKQLRRQVEKLSNRCGLEYALADICSLASSGDWMSDTNLSTALYSKISEYNNVLGGYATELITAVAGGPLALLQLIEGLINKISSIQTSEDLSSLLSSTEIVLNDFAAGLVLQTVGQVISAVGLVVASVSRIAAAIISIAGVITTIAGRIVVSATTAFDSTQFSVKSGSEVTHAFSFVLDQSEVTDHALASFMREKGWDRMTVVCPMQAAVYMMYLDQYDSASNDLIHYEVHLSSDVDISQNVREVLIDGSGIPAVVVDCPNKVSDDKFQCSLAYMPPYDIPAEGKVQSSYFVIKNHSSSDETTPSYSLSIMKGINDANLIFPAEFTLLDQLKEWYSGELNNFLEVRLASALILHLGWKFSTLIAKGFTKFTGNQNILLGLRHFNTDYASTCFSMLENVWIMAWKCFVSTNSFTAQSKLKSTFGYDSSSDFDNLLHAIQTAYDKLAFRNYAPRTLPQQPIRVVSDGVGGIVVNEFGSAGHDLSHDDVEWFVESKYDLSVATTTTNMFVNYASGVWSKTCAISLPTLTFTGFIAGLIVDGLLIAAMAAISVVVTVGWIKVRNKRAQLQAKAEASWYTYQDDQSNDNWRTYKKDRFKYNVLAVCTGGTVLNMGLYDDTTSFTELLPNLKGFVEDSEDGENITLKQVLLSIKGHV